MVIIRVLSTLWSLLSTKRRIVFSILVGLLLVAGVAEMGGMIVIFGFIHGLEANADGTRTGPLAKVLALTLGEPLTQMQYTMYAGAIVLVFVIGKNGLSTLVQFAMTRFLMKLNHRISKKLLDGYLLAPYRTFLARGPERIRNEIRKTYSVFSTCFAASAQALADSTTLFMVAALLLFINPLLTITAVAAFGGAGVLSYSLLQRMIRDYSRSAKRAGKESGRHLFDALGGIVETRLRDARQHFSRRYSKTLAQENLFKRRLIGMQRLPRATNEVLLSSMIVGGVFYLTTTHQSITDALPTLALFGFAGMRMTGLMTRLSRSLQTLRHQADEFERFRDRVQTTAPEVLERGGRSQLQSYLAFEDPAAIRQAGTTFTSLEFDSVEYRYPKAKTPALENVTFKVERGQFVSFCGPSGAGKSTLLLLLMGLVSPTRGSLRFNGQDLNTVLRTWHEQIGYVAQDLFIAHGNIRQNVAFGVPDEAIDDERVWEALRLARANTFVERYPKKLEHPLEHGSRLSGGERQRIAIARALYRDPEVLVLDEATAALDNTTEREFSDAIAGLSGNKTIICVAHRLSTIRMSDRIHFLTDGRITASGSYDELMRDCSAFEQMAQAPKAVHERSRANLRETPPTK